MTRVTNTGQVDLDITVDGGFLAAPAGATVDVPDELAFRLPKPPFTIGTPVRPTRAPAVKRARRAQAAKATAAPAVPAPTETPEET